MDTFRMDAHSVIACKGQVQYGNSEETSASRRAYERGDLLRLSATLPRQLGVTKAWFSIRNDATKVVVSVPLRWVGLTGNCDRWAGELAPDTLGADLYFLRVDIESIVGHLMTVRESGEACRFTYADDTCFSYQLTMCEFAYPAPEWIWGGTIYQVFVDRFHRGAETPVREDAILNPDWEHGIPQYPEYPGAPLKNNMFFGGNLDGVTEKLDYIAALGVNCIYLSPIFEAYSNHKYDTADYMKIDEMFGGEEALLRLLEQARRRNIRIVLDGVFNHTGDDSIYFNRYGRYDSIGAYQSKDSPYYSWYEFQHYPDEYTCWWNIRILPRINTRVPACRDYFLAPGGVIDRYAKLGIGGFRLDVVDELPDEFVSGIKERLSESLPDGVLYGEVWEDASNKIAYGQRRGYFLGKQLDGVMNYRLRTGLIDYVRYHTTDALRYAICEVMPNAPKRVQDTQMNLFGTHDTVRILTALAGAGAQGLSNDQLAVAKLSASERERGIRMLKEAYLIMATLPGVPLIYYGDEVGMEGYSDPFNRLPFPWNRMDEELLSYFREVGALRRSHAAYATGDFVLHCMNEEQLVFSRGEGTHRYVTLVNNADSVRRVSFSASPRSLLGPACKGRSLLLGPGEGAVVACKCGTTLTFERQ